MPIVRPQRFVITGEVRLARSLIEDEGEGFAVNIVRAMAAELEGYLFVTSPVELWERPFEVRQEWDAVQDYLVLKARGSGYFGVESDGADEVIDITPDEDTYMPAHATVRGNVSDN